MKYFGVDSGVTEPKRSCHRSARHNGALALALGGVVLGMFALSFAAVPLYRMFCQLTGYGGTTQRAEASRGNIVDRRIAVRFDANVAVGLPWTFKPMTRVLELRLGETALVHFEAANTTLKTTYGTATYNVTPPAAGRYFNKIECFCFTAQMLEPRGEAQLPVEFFVDPEILQDLVTRHVSEITLSYTFFPAQGPPSAGQASVADWPRGGWVNGS